MSRGEVTADPLPEPVAGITYIMRTSSACQTPHFDRFHENYRHRFVSDELSYSDLDRFHFLQGTNKAPERRMTTPEWAWYDAQLFETIVSYLEDIY
jgi:hypothetical protein